ncbi:tyrosine-type recombinase/integrase [Cellulosilyticum sp. I15G10I2]|uniref:tyrosine-type recombinase/integrase n=1 Tax=Cellulosilyticum sp. I15G10I2 TaxID=1892843 RepID=UPI000AD5ACD3|nr:tyrosine-type recombinase/integrase [Cellulosilyticum sp. I15G10I2]
MDSVGINVFVIPRGYYPSEEQYIPYIYTVIELKKFFTETDQCHIVSACPYRHLIMPIFFRMLYSCDLRVSEVRLLKVTDVDIRNGILTINHSEKDNCRLLPMSDDLLERCKAYYNSMHTFMNENNYFFLGATGKPMTNSNIYHNFRRFLWYAGIAHGGRGKGPRIHDFRHAFVCHCLKKWFKEKKDLSVYLPILKTYMVHDSFHETAYYLRMTADVFPDITIKLEGQYPDIIPKLGGRLNETN